MAILFALRGAAGSSLGTLVSSKVNQWTLLVGMLPVVYCLSAGHLGAMRLDARQVEEILLTSSQSLLAVSMLANFRFSSWEALTLLGLFAAQLSMPSAEIRYIFAGVYLVLTGALLFRYSKRRKAVWKLLTSAWGFHR